MSNPNETQPCASANSLDKPSQSDSNSRVLHILPRSEEVKSLYSNHGTFHEGDSGLDLFVVEDAVVKAGETAFLNLGIQAAAYDEKNCNISWLAMPRSSISKTPLRLSNSVGLIDAGYRGDIIACVDNIRSKDYEVKKGDRLVQAVFPDLKPFGFKIVDQLTQTSRGQGGFGSTETKKVLETKEKGEEKPAPDCEQVKAPCPEGEAKTEGENLKPTDAARKRSLSGAADEARDSKKIRTEEQQQQPVQEV